MLSRAIHVHGGAKRAESTPELAWHYAERMTLLLFGTMEQHRSKIEDYGYGGVDVRQCKLIAYWRHYAADARLVKFNPD